jgi:plastocyanin
MDYQYSTTALTVAPGATITLTFTNTGPHEHNMTASGLGINLDAQPGTPATFTFTAPQSGSFLFHPNLMNGAITVTGSSPAVVPSPTGTPPGGGGYGLPYGG